MKENKNKEFMVKITEAVVRYRKVNADSAAEATQKAQKETVYCVDSEVELLDSDSYEIAFDCVNA